MGTELQLGYMYCRRSIPRETVNSCPLAYLFNSPISLSFMPNRSVFFVSDGTGITAETFGKAILAQFEISPRQVRLPFMDSVDKAHQAVRQINHAAEVDGKRPIVFSTLVNMEVLAVIKETCQGMVPPC